MKSRQERIKNFEDFARYATEMIVLMEDDRKKTEETLRVLRESVHQLGGSVQRLGENDQRREEVMEGLLKTVTLIQADIVRIDGGDPER